MNEINNQETTNIVSEKIEFLKNPPEFYNLSYNDLLYIRENFTILDSKFKERFDDIEKRIKESEKEYKLKNYHYQQSHPETCAIACYMMAISNYLRNGFRPNKDTETEFFFLMTKELQ